MGKKEWILKDRSYMFAVKIVRLAQFLQQEKKEFVLSKQVLKSGTSVGALIREAEFAQSDADFINKLSISLKEANEAAFWLSLLKDTDYIEENLYRSLFMDCDEIISMLVSSIKSMKNKKLSTPNS